MDLDDLERKVKFYEGRVSTNFDYNFNQLVLEDFYGGGYDLRIEDEWFLEEYFEDYENDIIELLLEIEDEGEEYDEFKQRLIKLKRIIDTKLLKIGKQLSDEPKRRIRSVFFVLNPKLDKKKFIEFLFNELSSREFIETEMEKFILLFQKSNDDFERIQWLGTELQITFFISQLIDLGYLDPEINNYKYRLIRIHFKNKKGREFDNKQLGSVFWDKKETLPKDDRILKVIKKVSTHF